MSTVSLHSDEEIFSQVPNKNKSLSSNLSAIYWLSFVCAFFTTILALALIFGFNGIYLSILGITVVTGLASFTLIRKTSKVLPIISKISALLTFCIIGIYLIRQIYADPIDHLLTLHLQFATAGFLIPLILLHIYIAFGSIGRSMVLALYTCLLLASLPYFINYDQRVDDDFIYSFHIFILCVTTAFIFIYIGALSLLRKESNKKYEAVLEFTSKDNLTNLANRKTFIDFLDQRYNKQVEDNEFASYGLLSVDINNFSRTNDTYGNVVGDSCLQAMGKRIKNSLPKGGFLARTDSDEFALYFPISDLQNTASYCKELTSLLNERYDLEPYKLDLSVTVVGSDFPTKDESCSILIKKLQWTMNTAKREHNSYLLYSPELGKYYTYQKQIEEALASAIHNSELELFYQPLVNLETGKVESAEALLRWHSQTLGNISPVDFIPIAEASGLILSIGDWVIETACKQLHTWQELGFDYAIAINISTAQFNQKNFVENIQTSLARHKVEPRNLHLEITESLAMDQVTFHELEALKQLGCTIKLDDFGTGYSSLSIVKSLPLNQLKIDKAFVMDLDSDFDSQGWMMVKTIITLAHNFNLQVVAEGVESAEQLEHLSKLGCNYAQGFYISKPIPIESFQEQFLTLGNQSQNSTNNFTSL